MTRGFPDISANGVNYVVAVDGVFSLVYGTSASAPVVGAIFTLINAERINAGKAPIGFVNPVLYANPGVLNDITSGGNQGCGTAGFTAVEGWDPVTGECSCLVLLSSIVLWCFVHRWIEKSIKFYDSRIVY